MNNRIACMLVVILLGLGHNWVRGANFNNLDVSRGYPFYRALIDHPNQNMGGYNMGGYNMGGYNMGGYNMGGPSMSSHNMSGYNVGGPSMGGYNMGGPSMSSHNMGGPGMSGYNMGGPSMGSYNMGGYNMNGSSVGGGPSMGSYNMGGQNMIECNMGGPSIGSYGVGGQTMSVYSVGGQNMGGYGVGGPSMGGYNMGGPSMGGYNMGSYSIGSYNMGGHSVNGYSVGGHSVNEYSMGGSSMSSYDVGGHNMNGYSVGGHNMNGPSMVGPNMNVHSVGGHNMNVYNMGGHGVNGYNVGGHGVNGYNVCGHNMIECNIRGPSMSSYGVGGQTMNVHSVGGQNMGGYGIDGYSAGGYSMGGQNVSGYGVGMQNVNGSGAGGYIMKEPAAGGPNVCGYNADGYSVGGQNVGGYDASEQAVNGSDVSRYNVGRYDADGDSADDCDADGYSADGYDADEYERNVYDDIDDQDNEDDLSQQDSDIGTEIDKAAGETKLELSIMHALFSLGKLKEDRNSANHLNYILTRSKEIKQMYHITIKNRKVVLELRSKPAADNPEVARLKTILMSNVASIRANIMRIRCLVYATSIDEYVSLLIFIRLVNAFVIIIQDWIPPSVAVRHLNFNQTMTNFREALSLATRPKTTYNGTMVLSFKTFPAIEIGFLICQFKNATDVVFRQQYHPNGSFEMRMKHATIQTSLLGSQNDSAKILVTNLLLANNEQSDQLIEYLQKKSDLKLTLHIYIASFIKSANLDSTRSSNPNTLAQTQSDQINHEQLKEITDDICLLARKLPYQSIEIVPGSLPNVMFSSNHLMQCIHVFNAIRTTSNKPRLALKGFLYVDTKDNKPLPPSIMCEFSHIFLINVSNVFVFLLIDMIDATEPLEISLYHGMNCNESQNIIDALKRADKPNLTISFCPIWRFLRADYPTIESITTMAQQLSEHMHLFIPITNHKNSYNLIEFANLSIWANNPFPNPELIDRCIFKSSLFSPGSHTINRMFDFRDIRHCTGLMPINKTIEYLNTMLKYILSITPTTPLKTYHRITSIKVRVYHSIYKCDTIELPLTILRFIIQIYPTIRKISLTRIVADDKTADVFKTALIREWKRMRSNNPDRSLPYVQILIFNPHNSQLYFYRLARISSTGQQTQPIVEKVLDINPHSEKHQIIMQ
ncbi:hypothetical protein NEHOM01_0349 [Nematocida homosporus]|uniref:uncharacterized protein n=1 Tax=Nematocida homosporus TaxID=1912981 RepID=UPI00221F7663|nr:uncharacterized protein NEHOM01_0349 [Nematocida homosporus]KAI5184747.1 hypothetical protein NEHOM01_0349 [Nematocida homosporus]